MNVGIGGSQLMQPGVTYTSTGTASDLTSVPISAVICFTAETLTRRRELVPIETLEPGDLVATLENGPQPVRWTGTRHISRADLLARPSLRPVHIDTGVLGNARPLLLSPPHRLLLSN